MKYYIAIVIIVTAGILATVIVSDVEEMETITGSYYVLPAQTHNPQKTAPASALQTDGTNIRVEVKR